MQPFEIKPFPVERNLLVDAGYLAARRHIVYGLVEVDITRPRQVISDLQNTGQERLSLTAYLAANLGRAAASYPEVLSYRDWLGRLVVFHEADVVVLIEAEAGSVAVPHIIRSAQDKTVRQISEEIRLVQANARSSPQKSGRLSRLAPYLPRFVRLLAVSLVRKSPVHFRRMAGTIVLSSVGMFFKSGGWGVNFLPYHTCGLVVGGIAQKPVLCDGQIQNHEFLDLTFSFDHDVVDGAPAARFARRCCELIEAGDLLADD